MSRATKRKHVLKEIFDDDYSPPKPNQTIVRVLKNKGNNLHEVTAPDDSVFLVSMPTKFRKTIWVRRGNFVLVEPIEEGNKVKAEIVRILTNDHIKYYKTDGIWPKEFNANNEETDDRGDEEGSDDGTDDDLPPNPNRVQICDGVSSDSDSSEESDSERTDDSEDDEKNTK